MKTMGRSLWTITRNKQLDYLTESHWWTNDNRAKLIQHTKRKRETPDFHNYCDLAAVEAWHFTSIVIFTDEKYKFGVPIIGLGTGVIITYAISWVASFFWDPNNSDNAVYQQKF